MTYLQTLGMASRVGIVVISLHSVVTLLGFCRRYGVHYRLLSTCVGSFTCPGIDAQVQGTSFSSHPTDPLCIHLFTSFFCMCPGRDRTRSLTLLGLYGKSSPAGQDIVSASTLQQTQQITLDGEVFTQTKLML
jgi:hypothetical protein